MVFRLTDLMGEGNSISSETNVKLLTGLELGKTNSRPRVFMRCLMREHFPLLVEVSDI